MSTADGLCQLLVIGQLQIGLDFTLVVHHGNEALIQIHELRNTEQTENKQSSYGKVLAGNLRYIHVVSGWANILVLLAVEDLYAHQVNFGMTVLSGLGGRHIHDLKWGWNRDGQLLPCMARPSTKQNRSCAMPKPARDG